MRPRATAARNHGLTWPLFIVVLAIIAGVALGWWTFQSPRHVAKVNGHGITRTELASAMRASLWKEGRQWDRLQSEEQRAFREAALQSLIDDHLLSQLPAHASTQQSEEAFQQFIKQFETEELWRGRMAGQGLNEVTLRESLTQETGRIGGLENAVSLHTTPPTEAEAKAWYDAHKATLSVPERVRASHFFLSGHDREKPDREWEIREFHRQLVAQETTLPALASRLSDDERSKKKGGDLGWFSRERIPQDFADAVFSLSPGVLSAPFQTRLGWHIVMVQEKLPARPATFKEVQPEIMALLDTKRRAQEVQNILIGLRAAAKIERQEAVLSQVVPAE